MRLGADLDLFTEKSLHHRRGEFLALPTGMSFGGGQMVRGPGFSTFYWQILSWRHRETLPTTQQLTNLSKAYFSPMPSSESQAFSPVRYDMYMPGAFSLANASGYRRTCGVCLKTLPVSSPKPVGALRKIPPPSVLMSGPVRFFCYFWTNRNRNRLPNAEIKNRVDTAKNCKKPVQISLNWFELQPVKTDRNQYFSSIYMY